MTNTEVANTLRKALAIFGPNGENWWNGRCGEGVFCTQTAIFQVLSGWPADANEFIKALGFDSIQRTPEVKAAYEKAIAAAEQP